MDGNSRRNVQSTPRPAGSASSVSGRRALRKPEDTAGALSPAAVSRTGRNVQNTPDADEGLIIHEYRRPDRSAIALIIVLLCLGTIMVFSASYPTAQAEFGDSTYYIKRQTVFALLGLAVMFGICSIGKGRKIKLIKWGAPIIYAAAVVMLIAVLFIGTSEGVAKRWIYIGPFSFQPSEFMKFAMVVMLAWYIDRYRDIVISRPKIKFKRGTRKAWLLSFLGRTGFPCMIIGLACGLVLLEKHLSGTIILAAIGITVLAIGGANLIESGLLIGVGGAACGGLFLLLNPYAMERIMTLISGNADVQNGAWQTTQGLYAIGSGGLLGLGLGCSRLKYSYIYGAHTDFIFSIWCEEMGFAGAVFLILLYVALIWRFIIIAMRAADTFSSLVVFGLTAHVAIQVLTNIAVVTGVFPNTGVTLPFFSYGGTSTVILLGEMGVLLEISRNSYQRK